MAWTKEMVIKILIAFVVLLLTLVVIFALIDYLNDLGEKARSPIEEYESVGKIESEILAPCKYTEKRPEMAFYWRLGT